MTTSRKAVADTLKSAAAFLFFRYRFSVTYELGLESWGRRRADIVACKISGKVVIVEVKSSVADLSTDKKYQEYMKYSDQFYLAFTEGVWLKIKNKPTLLASIPKSVGVILHDNQTGYAYIFRKAKNRDVTPEDRLKILARLAWRHGDLSKRNKRSRMRVYLPD